MFNRCWSIVVHFFSPFFPYNVYTSTFFFYPFFSLSYFAHATYLSSPSRTITQLFLLHSFVTGYGIRVAFTFFFLFSFSFSFRLPSNRCIFDDNWRGLSSRCMNFNTDVSSARHDFKSGFPFNQDRNISLRVICPLFKRSIHFFLVKKKNLLRWIRVLICILSIIDRWLHSIISILRNSFFSSFGRQREREKKRTSLRNTDCENPSFVRFVKKKYFLIYFYKNSILPERRKQKLIINPRIWEVRNIFQI